MMATVQIPGKKRFYTQMAVHTATHNIDVSLGQEFKDDF